VAGENRLPTVRRRPTHGMATFSAIIFGPLLKRGSSSPGGPFGRLGSAWASVRGHKHGLRAALEAAVWDAEAKQKKYFRSRKLIGGVREENRQRRIRRELKASLEELVQAVLKLRT